MAVILFSEAILDALEAAWKLPLTLPERLHLIPPCKMRLRSTYSTQQSPVVTHESLHILGAAVTHTVGFR